MAKIWIVFVVFSMMVHLLYAQPSLDTVNRIDENGLKQGYWQKKDATGNLLYTGSFKDNKPTGEFTYFNDDETVKARSWFSDGGNYTKTFTYHKNGKVMTEGFYKDRIKDSLWRYFNNQGILVSEEFYRNSLQQGFWRTFHPNGQTAEEVYWENGKKNGIWKQYYSDGGLKLEGNYTDGSKEGLYRYYFLGGQVSLEGMYRNSLRDGKWVFYSPEGAIVKNEYYIQGYIIRTEEFGKIE